jgi:hypothetical protein
MPEADEPELIRRAQRDPQAFGLLYDRYVRRLYAFANHRHTELTERRYQCTSVSPSCSVASAVLRRSSGPLKH